MKKALIAMSGGVDSSVAAAIMQDRGYECVGVTMKLYDKDEVGIDESVKTSCSLDGIEDARKVANQLGIPFKVIDFSSDFRSCVIDRFVECYMNGMTPNPCVDCNRNLKFGQLYKAAHELGCDTIVTGHYARIICGDASSNTTGNGEIDSVDGGSGAASATGRYMLAKGVSEDKDQSYVLYNLSQEQLAHTQFPVGELSKDEVRRIAEEKGLVVAHKHDSQDICFIPDGDYQRFLEKYTGHKWSEGNFVDDAGNVLGRHKGICCYTIGQRKGLGIAFGHPVFVSEIRPETNEVVLSDSESLMYRTCFAKNFNWVSIPKPDGPIKVLGKIRFKAREAAGIAVCEELNVHLHTDGLHNTQAGSVVKMTFDQPQRAITDGQSLVLYDGDKVIGGGVICGKEK